jgi:hypothetical protein
MAQKIQDPCENMFFFQGNFIPRNLKVCECYEHLLHLIKFIFASLYGRFFEQELNLKPNCSFMFAKST